MMYNQNDHDVIVYDNKKKTQTLKIIAIALAFFVLGVAIATGLMAYRSYTYSLEAQKEIDSLRRQLSAAVEQTGNLPLTQTSSVTSNGSNEPVVAIASACKPSVVGVSVYIDQSAAGQYYNPFGGMFPFGNFGNYDNPNARKQNEQSNSDPIYTLYGTGSGVIISANGYVVTNHHVIEGADKVTLTLSDGTEVDATIIGSDQYSDIALLKMDEEIPGLVCASFGDSSTLQVGEMCVAIGNPLGTELFGTVTMGIISATDRTIELENGRTITTIQTDAAINSGNSGGGLFNSKGELIGITNMKMSASGYSEASIEGLGFAIPINEALSIVNELKEKGEVTYPTLGIGAMNFSQNQASLYPNLEEGVLVTSVQDGSPAQKAGIEVYDIITHFNGAKIANFTELQNKLYQAHVGDTITLTIIHDGQSKDVQVTLVYDSESNL